MTTNILVVEDNWIAAEMVRMVLESRGYSVLVATTGRQAMEGISLQEYHLILLDLMLPDVDGAQLLQILRRLPGCEDIPIVAFSAFVSRLNDLKSQGAGFDDYIAKPVEPQELIRVIDANLARSLVPPSV